MRKLLPFALLGFDTDNDSVFMNETVTDYWHGAGVEFTALGRIARTTRRGWSRRTVPWCVTRWATGVMRVGGRGRVGRPVSVASLFVNFFSPRSRLAEKSATAPRYEAVSPPATPTSVWYRTHERRQPRTSGWRRFTHTLDPVPVAERDPVWPTAACGSPIVPCLARSLRRPHRRWRSSCRACGRMREARCAQPVDPRRRPKRWPASSGSARSGDGAVA